MSKTLYIVRGLPGSGKSTLALRICPTVFSADDFFTDNDKYEFDGSKLKEAHAHCYEQVCSAMIRGVQNISVANTFTRLREVEPYVGLAKLNGYSVQIIHCEDAFDRNGAFGDIHHVPSRTYYSMRERWEAWRR